MRGVPAPKSIGRKEGESRSNCGRIATLSGAAIASLVAVMFLTAPLAEARVVHPPFLTAPYSGTPFQGGSWNAGGCGWTSSTPKMASFSTTTGVFLGSVKSTSKGCGTAGNFVFTVVDGGLSPSASFTVTSGLHHFVVHWTVTVNVTLKATPSGATPGADALTTVTLEGSLFDGTNATSYAAAFGTSIVNSTTAGSVNWHGTKHLVADINATLVSTHTYYLELYVYGEAYASTSPGANTASASLNIGTAGDQAKMASVTMT